MFNKICYFIDNIIVFYGQLTSITTVKSTARGVKTRILCCSSDVVNNIRPFGQRYLNYQTRIFGRTHLRAHGDIEKKK